MNANEVRLSLSNEQIISLMAGLGATEYKEDDKALIFRTICHNIDITNASFKLYYYKDTKLFHCYSGCGDTFNIYELFKRYYEVRGIEKSFYDIFSIITNGAQDIDEGFETFVYQKETKYKRRQIIELPEYNSGVLDVFNKTYPSEWINEGISPKTMDKYNILYSISQNKIIIPHYDIDGRLVGIRGRALNPDEVEKGKYKPVIIEDKIYNHPLSLNLYGLNFNKQDINNTNTVILFESEKSVMMMDSYFEINNSVAVCGSNFNKNQLLILLRNCNINNIIIAFDKEYKEICSPESEKYFSKLRNIGEKYNNYCNFYYIADKEGLLNYKDSPIDKGAKIFQYLLSKKMLIRSRNGI